MTVRQDLEHSIAVAEAARGSYLLFATESEDQKAKQVFGDMAEDMQRHVKILESRRDYLDQHNQLNGANGQGQSGGQDGSGGDGRNQQQNKNKNKNQNQNQNQNQ